MIIYTVEALRDYLGCLPSDMQLGSGIGEGVDVQQIDGELYFDVPDEESV